MKSRTFFNILRIICSFIMRFSYPLMINEEITKFEIWDTLLGVYFHFSYHIFSLLFHFSKCQPGVYTLHSQFHFALKNSHLLLMTKPAILFCQVLPVSAEVKSVSFEKSVHFSLAFAARFLNCVWPFWDNMH